MFFSACLSNVFYNTVELKGILKPEFSDKGSNKRPKQEQSWIFLGDFLDECDGM